MVIGGYCGDYSALFLLTNMQKIYFAQFRPSNSDFGFDIGETTLLPRWDLLIALAMTQGTRNLGFTSHSKEASKVK
jgi:hypothetical protein